MTENGQLAPAAALAPGFVLTEWPLWDVEAARRGFERSGDEEVPKVLKRALRAAVSGFCSWAGVGRGAGGVSGLRFMGLGGWAVMCDGAGVQSRRFAATAGMASLPGGDAEDGAGSVRAREVCLDSSTGFARNVHGVGHLLFASACSENSKFTTRSLHDGYEVTRRRDCNIEAYRAHHTRDGQIATRGRSPLPIRTTRVCQFSTLTAFHFSTKIVKGVLATRIQHQPDAVKPADPTQPLV